MKELKLGFKLLRYGEGKLSASIAAIIFLAVGILGALVSGLAYMDSAQMDYMLMVSGLWVSQVLISVPVSGLVQSTKWKKALHTSVMAKMNGLTYVFLFFVLILLKLPAYLAATPEQKAIIYLQILEALLMSLSLMLYSGASYKAFVSSTILFFVGFMLLMIVNGVLWNLMCHDMIPGFEQVLSGLPFWSIIVIGIAIISLGSVLQYGISVALYPLPLAKKGQMRVVQKIM